MIAEVFWKCCLPTLLATYGLLSAEIPERDLGAFHRPTDGDESFIPAVATGPLAGIAQAASFKSWKTFEDERVRFIYPDHEQIRVEVKEGEPVPLAGDRVSSVDTSFSRAYRITAGGETLTAFFLKDADWFDDGICLCGEIVYDRYLVREGHFYRFGFLKSGIMKKMEVLGDRERLMSFEWTHSLLHPEVYRQIARSVELRRAGKWTAEESRRLVRERFSAKEAVGWFDEGASLDTVVASLGGPTGMTDDGAWVWKKVVEEKGYRSTERTTLPFSNGKLVRFGADYYDSGWEAREAVEGSIPWMKEKSEFYDEPRAITAKGKIMPEELGRELQSLFLKHAEAEGQDFNDLCQVMSVLVQQGFHDKKALDIVRQRFRVEGGHYAAWVLHEAGEEADVGLFVDKIRGLYREGQLKPDENVVAGLDLHNWLSFIPDEDDRYPALLREGFTNPNASVRESAFYFLDSAPLPQDERLVFLRAGLKDPAAGVRNWSAGLYSKIEISEGDWQLLEEISSQEKDESTHRKMLEILKARKSKADGKTGE